jgi:hypothetical protein
MMYLLAQATMNAQTQGDGAVGSWVIIAMLVVNGIAASVGVLAIFATRRDVEQVIKMAEAAMKRAEAVDEDLQDYKQKVNDNGELRKNFIIQHIDAKQKETRDAIDRVHQRIDAMKE